MWNNRRKLGDDFTGSRLFGATISAPAISLLYVFCTDCFGANSVLFDSSLISGLELGLWVSVTKKHRILAPKRSVSKWSRGKVVDPDFTQLKFNIKFSTQSRFYNFVLQLVNICKIMLIYPNHASMKKTGQEKQFNYLSHYSIIETPMHVKVLENCYPSMKEVVMHNIAVMRKCKLIVNVETQYTSYIHFFNAPLTILNSHWYQSLVFFCSWKHHIFGFVGVAIYNHFPLVAPIIQIQANCL